MSGRTRFRALVRKVINNRPWLDELHVSKGVDKVIKENVLKIDMATREKYQSLTLANKSLLRKDASLRTEDDIDHLCKVIGNLKCFRRYPENVRKELVASTYFEYYGADRVLMKQTHVPTFLGFVLCGELEVSFTKVDPVFGDLVTEVLTHLGPGAVLGEVSLLHNIARTATITTLTPVELLILYKKDFDRVLKASMQKQWDEINSALKHFPYFDNWDEVAIRDCCMLSDTTNYEPEDIILGGGYGKSNSAHFVLYGICSMVQRLSIVRSNTGKYSLLPPDTKGPSEPLFMEVCQIKQGGSFNLGETLTNRTIVADNDVRVLRIPLYLLHQHNIANIWHRIRQFLESRLPSEQQLFSRYLEGRRWAAYRQRLCEDLLTSTAPHDTTLHDAPYYWRVLQLDPPEDRT